MIILLIILLLSLFSQPAFATDIDVVCPNDPSPNPTNLKCSLTPDNLPLFNESNIVPGFITIPSKLVSVDNQDTDNPCFLKVETIKKSGDDLLLDGIHRLNLSITSNSVPLYSGPVIFNNLSLDKVDIGSTRNYYWTVSFPQSADNDYRALSAVFDINLKFTCADNPDWQPPVTNPTSGVYLSEYMPKGSEWVEIFNTNDFPVILDDWKIDDDPTGGQNPWPIPYANIAAKSFYVVELGSGFLNDTKQSGKDYADYVVLINNQNGVVESTWYDTSSTDLSWSKQSDSTWCQAVPTKGDPNNYCYNQPTPTPGTVGGATTTSTSSSGSPQCTDAIPGTPSNLTATSLTGGQVKLDWTHADPPYTSYLIAYGPDENTFLYGNPNIGLSNTYTVSGLTPGAQYCFYVRAQNSCMPGLRSNIACVNSGSATLIVETTPPPGFEPGILGETTDEESTEIFDLTDIMGAEDQCPIKYIPLLFIIALLLNSLYFYKNPKGNFIFPVLVSFSTALIDWFILRKACCLVPDIFCQYFFVGNLISFVFPYRIFRKKHKTQLNP